MEDILWSNKNNNTKTITLIYHCVIKQRTEKATIKVEFDTDEPLIVALDITKPVSVNIILFLVPITKSSLVLYSSPCLESYCGFVRSKADMVLGNCWTLRLGNSYKSWTIFIWSLAAQSCMCCTEVSAQYPPVWSVVYVLCDCKDAILIMSQCQSVGSCTLHTLRHEFIRLLFLLAKVGDTWLIFNWEISDISPAKIGYFHNSTSPGWSWVTLIQSHTNTTTHNSTTGCRGFDK